MTVKKLKVKSGFALIDVEDGRAALAKVVESGHRIPFTLTGYLMGNAGSVGHDDGTSREFGAEVTKLELGEPEYVPADKIGRPYALAKDVKEGDVLQCDGGFTCMKEGTKKRVKHRHGHGDVLFISCDNGGHNLNGQLGEHGELIGLYKISRQPS